MKITEVYPVYVNPEFEECVEIGKSSWDTLRVLANKDYLIVGSGYGNTHERLSKLSKLVLLPRERYWETVTILYHMGQQAFWNLEDVCGKEKVSFESGLKLFTSEQKVMLRDIVRESGL